MAIAAWALGAAATLGAAVALLWAFQERAIFPVRHAGVPPVADGPWQVGEVDVPGHGAVRFRFGEGSGPVVLYFHGNASSTVMVSGYGHFLVEAGLVTVLASYPGYSGNPGAPSEAALQATAEAMERWARARWPGRPLVAWGESIGTHPASHLAGLGRADAVVLDSPFTSVADTAAKHFAFIPGVRRLVRHRMDNLAALRAMPHSIPVLVLVTAKDPVVPVAMGERIAAEVPGAELLRSPLTAHPVVLFDGAVARAAAAWAARRTAHGTAPPGTAAPGTAVPGADGPG